MFYCPYPLKCNLYREHFVEELDLVHGEEEIRACNIVNMIFLHITILKCKRIYYPLLSLKSLVSEEKSGKILSVNLSFRQYWTFIPGLSWKDCITYLKFEESVHLEFVSFS